MKILYLIAILIVVLIIPISIAGFIFN